MKKYFSPLILPATIAAVIFCINCTPKLANPDPQPGSCDFSRLVAIGGDFMSGYQDAALWHDAQMKSVPALLSRQLRFVGGGSFGSFAIPNNDGLGWNLKPWESWYNTSSHLNYKTDCQGVTALAPLKDSLSRINANYFIGQMDPATHHNFSVPFATTAELFSPALGNSPGVTNSNPFYRRLASNPGTSTAIGDAVNVNATFFMSWLGMEDIYDYAQFGGAGTTIPSVTQFSMYLDSALSRLTANGANGVIANIPDFRDFPFFTLIPWNGAKLTQIKADSLTDIYLTGGMPHISFHEGQNGFVIADANAPLGARLLHEGEYILLDAPLDSMKCEFYGLLINVMNDRYVLDSSEVANIEAAIAGYNIIIAQKAQQYDLALVDMNSYFNSVKTGIKWDGVDMNADFVTGGFFSLDGYHPNQKGYALITNEFISAINAKYGATIPTLNCFDCDGVIFP